MRKAEVFMGGKPAGIFEEVEYRKRYRFAYHDEYDGMPISLTMQVKEKAFEFDGFPPYFDGLLPEGILLEGLLKQRKIDKYDYFSQLVTVGEDLVGAVTVQEILK